ncbi:MAG: hypothetical protein ACK2T6_09950 [Anaerolineae bacterium]
MTPTRFISALTTLAAAAAILTGCATATDVADVSSTDEPPPAHLELEIEPRAGEAPLDVALRARLVGEPANPEAFNCPSLAWDFGNSDVLIAQAGDCRPGWVQREFEAQYTYPHAGSYDVSVRVLAGELEPSSPVQVLVTGPTPTAQPLAIVPGPTIIVATAAHTAAPVRATETTAPTTAVTEPATTVAMAAASATEPRATSRGAGAVGSAGTAVAIVPAATTSAGGPPAGIAPTERAPVRAPTATRAPRAAGRATRLAPAAAMATDLAETARRAAQRLSGGSTATMTGTTTSTPAATGTTTAAPTATHTVTPVDTATPTRAGTDTPASTEAETPTPATSQTPTRTATATSTQAGSATPTPSDTATATRFDTATPTPSRTDTPSPADTATPTPSRTRTPVPRRTEREAAAALVTSTPRPTASPSRQPAASQSSPPAAGANVLPGDIYYVSENDGLLWRLPATGTAPRPLSGILGPVETYAVTPGGRIAYISEGVLRVQIDDDSWRTAALSGASSPVWSADGTALAYAADGVWLVAPDTGEQTRIAPTGAPLAWSADGGQLLVRDDSGAPMLARVDGSRAVVLPIAPVGEAGWLPDRPAAWMLGPGLRMLTSGREITLSTLLDGDTRTSDGFALPGERFQLLADRGDGLRRHVVDLADPALAVVADGPSLPLAADAGFAWAPDGRLGAVAGTDGLTLLDPLTGARVHLVAEPSRDLQWAAPTD